jgi:hypothetical protein
MFILKLLHLLFEIEKQIERDIHGFCCCFYASLNHVVVVFFLGENIQIVFLYLNIFLKISARYIDQMF